MSIEVANVSKRFGDFVALDDVSVSIPSGQLTALLGRALADVSTCEYRAAAEAVPATFGIAQSSVSRRLIRTSAEALRQFHPRRRDDAT